MWRVYEAWEDFVDFWRHELNWKCDTLEEMRFGHRA